MTPAGRILQEKRRLIWPIAIVLLLNIGVFAAVVYPLSKKVANGEQDAQASAATLNAARRDFAAARATVTGKTQADTELKKFYADVLPPDLSGARRITYLRIEQLAKESNLRLERESTDPRAVRESDLIKVVYSASLAGEYRDIRRFIHAIETAPEFLVLENVALSQVDEERGLNVNVQIATYFRTGGNGN
ncbi:MAG TPA: type 4a pilus biogenesis protein PilO [Vicinamibacterales bacterium]